MQEENELYYKIMKKIIIRAAVLIVVFAVAFALRFMTIDEHSGSTEKLSTSANSANLPVLSFTVSGNEINLTEGYTVPMDGEVTRRSITPVSTEQKLGINIDAGTMSIKKIEISVHEFPDLNVLEEQEIADLKHTAGGRLSTEVQFSKAMTAGTEYLLKLVLLDSNGKKVYYYTRIEPANFGNLSKSIEFVRNFHLATFDKEKINEYAGYMETEEGRVNEDFSHVTIKDDIDTLSYGVLEPTEIYRMIPTITEYNDRFVSAAYNFWIQGYTDRGLETFRCLEGYRFKYGDERIILYNYDRTMETVFDPGFFDLMSGKLMLGVTPDPTVDTMISQDKSHMLLSYQGTLWMLDMKGNILTEVLSYKNKDAFYRQPDPAYDFKLLSIDNEGNAEFAVYGYIGKGDYEGRNGIIYYHYYAKDNRIEEKMFIPTNLGKAELEDSFGKVNFTSEMGIYYFSFFNSYYSYELDTNVLHTIISDMGENWLYFEKEKKLVYDEKQDKSSNTKIALYDIEKQETEYIEAPAGKVISLLGTIDKRIVYGISTASEFSFFDDGSLMIPYEKICIAELDGTEVKNYVPDPGKYVCELSFEEGFISLGLYSKVAYASRSSKALYEPSDKDVIVNLYKSSVPSPNYTSDRDLKQRKVYLLNMPSTYQPESGPKLETAVSTVITKDTSVGLQSRKKPYYYATAYGRTILMSNDLALCMKYADEAAGTVVDPEGSVVFRRSIYSEEKTLDRLKVRRDSQEIGSRKAALYMLLAYYGVPEENIDCNLARKSMLEWMNEKLGKNAVMLEKADVNLLCYFISNGNPVIAAYDNGYTLMYAYTKKYIYIMNPISGEKKRLERAEAQKAFDKAGGKYYVSY